MTQDVNTNRAIREVATTPDDFHVIPAEVVAKVYEHADAMRSEFFDGQVPEIVLSFDTTNKKTLGHYCLKRNGLGVRWNINLNPIHLARPMCHVLSTLLHEMAHAWQHEHGTPSKPPHHNAEFRAKCEAFGIPTDERGHDGGIVKDSPFAAYCVRHGVEVVVNGETPEPGKAPEPVLPAPPVKPGGSKLKKWVCACPVNVRVAVADFDATCNRCHEPFRRAE